MITVMVCAWCRRNAWTRGEKRVVVQSRHVYPLPPSLSGGNLWRGGGDGKGVARDVNEKGVDNFFFFFWIRKVEEEPGIIYYTSSSSVWSPPTPPPPSLCFKYLLMLLLLLLLFRPHCCCYCYGCGCTLHLSLSLFASAAAYTRQFPNVLTGKDEKEKENKKIPKPKRHAYF